MIFHSWNYYFTACIC